MHEQPVAHYQIITSYIIFPNSDAPALSTHADTAAVGGALAATTLTDSTEPAPAANTNGGDAAPAQEWDDEALAASYARKGAASTAEVLDMKAFDAKRRDQDDIAERMRVEETKAQLKAAKEGMEREAQRLKDEKEFKEVKKIKPEVAPRGPGLGGMMGSKWVPPHMRAGAGPLRARMTGAGASGFQKLDTQDENLFPDLAAADSIVEQRKEQVAYKVIKKTAVGGGATWGSRPPVVRPKAPKPEPEPEPAPEPAPAPEPVAVAPVVPAAALKAKKPTKKKKKDLSTFKPSS